MIGEKSDVSGDSKLYDLSFELGCFSVNLAMNGHLGSLDMGRATTTFKANADGSFDFGFAMADLRVDNKGTKDTLFHSILHLFDLFSDTYTVRECRFFDKKRYNPQE